jgi:hypothetical protein
MENFMPYMLVKGDNKVCVHKQNDDKSAGEVKHCYEGENAAEKAGQYMKALYASEGEKNMQSGFIFAELKGDVSAAFDGLPATDTLGYPLTDMRGNKVEIKKEDLSVLLENTQLAIESTRTESGEVVGLPIDLNNHDHQGGAGWIVGVELDAIRNVIRFIPRWTQAGLDLIKNDIRRFFSATFDPINRVIHGGSLTNSPATKNKRGQYLLRPIELSENLFVEEKQMEEKIDKTLLQEIADKFANLIASLKGDDKPEESKPEGETKMTDIAPVVEAVAEPANPTLTELLKTPEAIQELGKMAELKAQEFVKAEMRKKEIVEFASTLVGGSADSPYGLPVKASEVVALLLSLPPAQSEAVQMLLTKTMKATVNFMETGFNGDFNAHPRLPEIYKPSLNMWLAAGKSIDSFFAENVELGSEKDYNLSEFIKAA